MTIATSRRRAVAGAALVALVLAAGPLAACASNGSDSSGSGGQATTVPPMTTAPPGAADLLAAACAGTLTSTVNLGTVTSAELSEASGIVASPDHPGVWWTHNDSGDTARFFAVRENGSLAATFTLPGVTATDWEDIAIGPTIDATQPERPTLYLADMGDNARNRPEIVIHQVAEPDPDRPGDGLVPDEVALHLRYPDGPHDAEALIVDHDSGDLVIVTKDWSMAGQSQVYRAASTPGPTGATTLEHVATVTLPLATLVTGGDLSADGSVVALRSYDGVRLYPRPAGQPLWQAFASTPCPVAVVGEKQGEAVGFAPDGRSVVTISEGKQPVLHRTGL